MESITLYNRDIRKLFHLLKLFDEIKMKKLSKKNFFVSYNKSDSKWAEWIAWHLEESGYSTVIQAWDFRPGMNFVLNIQDAVVAAERTIAVVSEDYLDAIYTHSDWSTAFRRDPYGSEGFLLIIRVKPCALPGLFGQITSIDLFGLDERASRNALLAGVAKDRAKPLRPPDFPGVDAEDKKPIFPGTGEPLSSPRGLTPPEPVLARYLAVVRENARYWRIFERVLQHDIDLETIYVERKIEKSRNTARERVPAEEFLRRLQAGEYERKRFVVTSLPGMGKTTLFRRLALWLTQGASDWIPLMIVAPEAARILSSRRQSANTVCSKSFLFDCVNTS